MKSCWFPLFVVFLSQKAPVCDKGYESWDVQPLHLVLKSRRRYSGKSNYSVWFLLLNNKKPQNHKTSQPQNLLVVGITLSLNPNKRGLIVFFWWGKKAFYPSQISVSVAHGHGEELWGKERGLYCAFIPFFVFWDLFSLGCWHSQERIFVALTCAL